MIIYFNTQAKLYTEGLVNVHKIICIHTQAKFQNQKSQLITPKNKKGKIYLAEQQLHSWPHREEKPEAEDKIKKKIH